MEKLSWVLSFLESIAQVRGVVVSIVPKSFDNTFICRNDRDIRIWKHSTLGLVWVNALYQALEALPQPKYVCSLARQGLASPHVEAFCWLVY